ncbi:MAG: oligopeptide transporter, OPT family [Candidatus Omnitrophica bacterium]|nr:oligopeptide transporter, OPT family [Candidatus Omnitrophota bacterium]
MISDSESTTGIARPEPVESHTAPFQPYIPPEAVLREFSALPVIIGAVLGMVFGASSLYLVLKVGLTVSASIPVAVISITLFRILSKFGFRSASILENNIVQTTGSAGESIAFGIGVTMPAILILGYDLEITRVALVAVLGGLLGILMMIPLRRALIVQQHGQLKYPEGTACAEVLKAGASDECKSVALKGARGTRDLPHQIAAQEYGGARTIFTGFGIGLAYKAAMAAFKAWKDVPEKVFGAPFKAASISAEISPELLGVGYIIGPRLGAIMCAGGVLAYLVLIPAIKFFGEGLSKALPPGTVPIRDMSPDDIRGAYVLYIGAGAVAAGGIISLLRSLPIIWHGIKEGINMVGLGKASRPSARRTDRDLSILFVMAGILGLIVSIVLSPPLHMNVVGAILIVVFGFLFATVSSRLTGEIGSSSNPISGMTVATLLLTCLIFLILGWTGPHYYVTALSVGGIVCIAASNAGTTSQDLKTGFLIGATPRMQQIAILIGALCSALALGPILLQLNQAATVYVPRITFEPARGQPQILNSTTNLPLYSETQGLPPGGPFRLLQARSSQPLPNSIALEPGDYLVNTNGVVAWEILQNFPADLRANLSQLGQAEKLVGPQAAFDHQTYRVWQKTTETDGPPGRYLVDATGMPVYLVDPGINGVHKVRPDGTTVTKFDAPKATLMSYIIKGILSRQLPWGLVLLGIMISIVLELSGIPSLPFAVGVYLPLSSSSPIFVGGMIRWLVDQYLRKKHREANLTEEQLAAEGDKSPGVLMASGYIAGGAIAGIIIAFMAGVLNNATQAINNWAELHNPFYNGPYSDLLSLIPFVLLALALYLTGREVLFARRGQDGAH